MNFPRKSGILLHPTSLPGPYGMGEIGPVAREFVHTLHRAGILLTPLNDSYEAQSRDHQRNCRPVKGVPEHRVAGA